MIPPTVFIPIAEKTGLINQIGKWVLTEACQQTKKWQDSGLPKIRIAINISPLQFRAGNLSLVIIEVLKYSGLSAEYLEIEITESMILKDMTNLINTLNELKMLGITISIDDFGTEYSSLSRLKALPIDRIKMDM